MPGNKIQWEDLSDYEKSGYVGSLLLIVGPFLPLACVFGMCFNYILGGEGDGMIILVLGLISAYLVKIGKFKGLAATGGISLLMILNFLSEISGAIGAYTILVGSALVCYTSWNAWDTSHAPTGINTPPPPISTPLPPTGSSPISQPPKLIPVARPVATIECPECAAQMKVTKLGRLQNVTCDGCGMSGEINI